MVKWDERKLEAFNHLKVCLCNMCVLTIPSLEDYFYLHTYASGLGIGATLNAYRDEELKPVAYFSRQLQGAQKFYSATELEGLALFKAIFFFAHYLWGKKFTVVTDHQALVSLLKSNRLNKRLFGWMLKLLDFDFEVVYRPGKENADADCLSRQAWDSKEGELLTVATDGAETSRTTCRSEGGDVGLEPHIEGRRGSAPAERRI